MEAKKPNQISIKLNGSHLAKNDQKKSSRQRPADVKTQSRVSIAHPPQEGRSLITEPLSTEALNSTPPVSEVHTGDPDEDALSRLNELRQRASKVESLGYKQAPADLNNSKDDHDREASTEPGYAYGYDTYDPFQGINGREGDHAGPIIELDEDSSKHASGWGGRIFGKRAFNRRSLPPFTRAPWFRVAMSSIGAVSLGLIFGFAVLMVFKQEQLAQSYKTVLGGALQLPQDQTTGASPDAKPNEAMGTNPVASNGQVVLNQEAVQTVLSLPEQNLFLAQAGVFTDIASAQQVVDPLSKQGYPHFFYPMEGKQHLFVAMAPTRDEILGIANYLKSNQMDIYVKEVKLPTFEQEVSLSKALVNQDASAPDQNQVESYLASGFEVVKSLSTYSSRVLNQGATTEPISQAEENQLRELHRKFVDQGRVVQAGVPLEWQSYFKNMEDGLSKAVTALNGMKTSNAQSYAWQAQNGVFQYISNYMDWMNKIKAQQ